MNTVALMVSFSCLKKTLRRRYSSLAGCLLILRCQTSVALILFLLVFASYATAGKVVSLGPRSARATVKKSAVEWSDEVATRSKTDGPDNSLHPLHRRGNTMTSARPYDIEMGPVELTADQQPTAPTRPISRWNSHPPIADQQPATPTRLTSRRSSSPPIGGISTHGNIYPRVLTGSSQHILGDRPALNPQERSRNAGHATPGSQARMHSQHVDHLITHHNLSPKHQDADRRLLQRIGDPNLRHRTAFFLGLHDRAHSEAGPGQTPNQECIMRLMRTYGVQRRKVPAM